MKKIIVLILSAIMILMILPLNVFADAPIEQRGDYVCGDYEYNIISEEEKTCKIMYYTGSTEVEKLVIPQTLDGYKVVSIGGWSFYCKPMLCHIVIPEGVKSLEDVAFSWFGDGEYIDDIWHSYSEITIPKSVTYIGEKTFFCHFIGRVYGYSGSYAETYVKENMSSDFIPIDVSICTLTIQEPSRIEIRNNDGIVLHTNIGGIDTTGYVVWTSNNDNFTKDADGNNVKIIAKNKGWTTFTATLYDADGNELAFDSVEMYSKSGFFEKIGGFFRKLFGSTVIYEE